LTAATCSRIAVSGQGRIAVSGPEVIETNKGVEEFDSKNKALVWSTDGGKNRRLIGGADAFAEDSMEGFRAAAKTLLAKVPAFRRLLQTYPTPNAGELVVAELMRAIVQARSAGVAVIALVGGKAGAFGFAGVPCGREPRAPVLLFWRH
jgi:hypothetical protein